MKGIKLHSKKYSGIIALVDDSDFDEINKYRWQLTKRAYTFYAVRRAGSKPGIIVYMHRQILGLTKESKIMVDHKDGDGLNNQTSNLRIATKSQNGQNIKARKNKLSKFKGVTKKDYGKKWVAAINKNGKRIHLGCFESELEAAFAYNKKAVEMFGEFAYLNSIN